MLTIVYGLAAGLCALWWNRWRTLTRGLSYGRKLYTSLVVSYWGLFASLCYGMLLSWQQRGLYGLNIAALFQAAAFGYIFTPVVMRVRHIRTGFLRTAIATECCVMTPTSLLVLTNFWFFAQANDLVKSMLTK